MILLIGYGNPLRSDDGAGHLVVERLVALNPDSKVRGLTEHQLLPEMAEDVSRPDVEAVVFVDAADASATRRKEPECLEVTPSRDAGPGGHHLAPDTLLALSLLLFNCSPPSWLVTVPGEMFDHGEDLSPLCLNNCEAACRMIEDLIRQSEAAPVVQPSCNSKHIAHSHSGRPLFGGWYRPEGGVCPRPLSGYDGRGRRS